MTKPAKPKPIPDEPFKRLSIPRYVATEPLTPGLRPKSQLQTQAIGFIAKVEIDEG